MNKLFSVFNEKDPKLCLSCFKNTHELLDDAHLRDHKLFVFLAVETKLIQKGETLFKGLTDLFTEASEGLTFKKIVICVEKCKYISVDTNILDD